LSYFGRSTAVISAGTWHHVFLGIDLSISGDIQIFIDGNPAKASSNLWNRHAFSTATDGLFIGEEAQGWILPFLGNMDEFAIWANEDLSSDIADIYNNGTPTNLNDLSSIPTAWYRMGDNSTFKSPQILMPENTNKDKESKYSMAFDGVDDYVDCGDVLHFSGDTPMTVSAWVKITTAAGHTSSVPVVNKKKVRMAPTYIMSGWAVDFLTSGAQTNRLCFSILGDGSSATGTLRKKALTLSFTDGLWHNIVVTYDGSEDAAGVKFYIDGTEDTTTQTLSNSFTGTLANDATVDLQIGKVPKYGGTNYMDGNIDELAIFNSVKAIGDIWDGSGSPTDLTGESGLVSWWRMGEQATFSTNWSVFDAIGVNDGTSVNMSIEDRQGDASNSSINSLSYNMTESDIETETP